MAELDGGAPPSASRKKSPPIEDFGKDFLSSWKSSKAGNSMDFDVETVPRTGKSSFNFDKLDDFDFGGDFGKLSSFQMDMSDLDFSVPLKKTAKANEKEPILGKQDLEKDKFSFTFDFNELDKFDLDTNSVETEKPSSKCLNEDGPHCSDEVLKHKKDLDLKSNLFPDDQLPKNHGNEILPNRQSLPTTASANILETDGPSYDAIAGHGSPHQVNKYQVCLDSVKANTDKEQASGVRSPNSSQSRNSSPVKSSNSRSCPPKSRTASQDCSKTFWNHEVDQHEVAEGGKSASETIQVHDEIAQTSAKEVPQKHIDASCFPFPISKMPGGTTTSCKANSPLEVQEVPKKDDNSHLTNSMTLRITKENSSNANTPINRVIKTVGVSEKSLISKLAVSSITDRLPLKRKAFKEPLIDLKALDKFKHINSSSKGRVTSSSSTKSISPNMVSAQSMNDTRKSPIAVQGSFQKDSKKFAPNLMSLRMSKVNISISNSSMSRETSIVGETKGNRASKLPGTFKTDKPVLLNPPLKTKTLEVQGAEQPDGAKSDASSLENPSSTNGTPELEKLDIEVPVVTENRGNIEKAESYSKELDDLFSMLKKKHEDAKELLVRAIVNNNELLMLNHPMIEEKRLAAGLQSKEYWKI